MAVPKTEVLPGRWALRSVASGFISTPAWRDASPERSPHNRVANPEESSGTIGVLVCLFGGLPGGSFFFAGIVRS